MNLKFHKNCDYTGKILKISCVRCISMKFDIHFLGLPFTIAFFAAVNHNNDHKQRTLQHRNIPNGLHSTNHKSQTMISFVPVKVKFSFLRGPLRWMTVAKNTNVSWLLNFRIRVFLKSAVKGGPGYWAFLIGHNLCDRQTIPVCNCPMPKATCFESSICLYKFITSLIWPLQTKWVF